MAVTKRTRYEVMRRDNFTCRYCRSTVNALTVDHVVPVALGGTDAPDNLVAACRDCNAGKSSSNPDGTLIEDVKQDALRHAEMIRQAYAVVVERMGDRDRYVDEFAAEYANRLPDGYEDSISRWFDMGVPIELLLDAIKITDRRKMYGTTESRFKYLCGIVWNQVHVVNEAVGLKSSIVGSFLTESELLDQKYEAHLDGRNYGEEIGSQATFDKFGLNDCYHRLLSNLVDGADTTDAPPLQWWFNGPDVDLTEPEAEKVWC